MNIQILFKTVVRNWAKLLSMMMLLLMMAVLLLMMMVMLLLMMLMMSRCIKDTARYHTL
jgi:hypothetical protein